MSGWVADSDGAIEAVGWRLESHPQVCAKQHISYYQVRETQSNLLVINRSAQSNKLVINRSAKHKATY